jgi:hypothetical protein
MVLALDRLDEEGYAIGDEPIVLTDDPSLVTVADSYNATVSLPADTPGGAYGLTLVQSTGTAGSISITFGELDVTGVPTAAVAEVAQATPRVVNAGLRSDTGWGETPAAGSAPGTSPLVAVGTGMLLLAAAGAAAALRPRRREVSETCYR